MAKVLEELKYAFLSNGMQYVVIDIGMMLMLVLYASNWGFQDMVKLLTRIMII